jgi:anhydro-N-acetylmuramic acid kinase
MYKAPQFYIGIMTGTSVDQADAVLVRFTDQSSKEQANNDSCPAVEKSFTIIDKIYLDFPVQLRAQIQDLCDQKCAHRLEDLSKTNILLAAFYAHAIEKLLVSAKLSAQDIEAIGCHGQTIWHAPHQTISWQLCEGNYLAALTSIPVVTDFRQLDVALGGQGAPLVPLFQRSFFQSTIENRVLLNLGGIANICVLSANQSTNAIGFDTGPANTLLDQWYQIHQDGEFDVDGKWAASGIINQSLLHSLLSDQYFSQKAPKSTGREYFNIQWLQKHLARFDSLSERDIQATLLELTAQSISFGLKQAITEPYSLYVFGGGAHNKALMNRLNQLLSDAISITSTDTIGIEGDIMEALCFAWLAKQRMDGEKLDATSITGSRKPHLFGTVYLP